MGLILQYIEEQKVVFKTDEGRMMSVDGSLCIACGLCEAECPTGAINLVSSGITGSDGVFYVTNETVFLYTNQCNGCEDCGGLTCPPLAIEFWSPEAPGGEDPGGEDDEPGGGPGGSGPGTSAIINEIPEFDCRSEGTALALSMIDDVSQPLYGFIQDVLGGTDDVVIKVKDGIVSPNTDAETIAYQDSGKLIIEIKMAVSLGCTSNENIVAAVLHELLHAMFRVKQWQNVPGFDGPTHHQLMASAYFDSLTSALMVYFPNLPQLDAEALTWDGLQASTVWQNLSAVDKNLILNRGDAYQKNGNKGSRCAFPPPNC